MVGRKVPLLMGTPDNYAARLKSIDEMRAARDLDGTNGGCGG